MKLPINPLLYLASLACAGGIVLNIMATVKPRIRWDRNTVEPKIRDDVKRLVDQGGRVLPDNDQWRYNASNPFWEQFKTANFTGYKAPEPVAKPTGESKPVAPGGLDVDLRQKLRLMCISLGGDNTRAVVQYLDQVEVPPKFKSRAAPAVPMPMGNRSGRGRRPPLMTTPMTNTVPTHHVDVGQALWPPYQNFVLVGVAEDALSVFFENRAKEKVKGHFPRQEVPKNELGLPDDVLERILKVRRGGARPKTQAAVDPRLGDQPKSKWQDVEKTKAIRENEWVVSRKDLGYIDQRGNKFIHEDVHLGDYSGGSGKTKIRGVAVRKLSRRARGLGVNEGDILISLNGIKVKNRAQALREGKRLWKKGVRSFKAVFLRRGQEITMFHHFPNK
jgi:hypothetical protein